jgi:hypothetical protein
MRKDPTRLLLALLARTGMPTFLNPITVARSSEIFSANPTTKFHNMAKKCHYFSGFSMLCNKISFWELKEVLFALAE